MSKENAVGPDGHALVAQALDGNRRALARLLTLVENGHPAGQEALTELFSRAGHAHVIGFTGSTGAGKSTLVNCVARELRRRNITLAVVAVDPSSPFSGGALLGDRLRMRDLVNDPGVFIRSMASRGHPGGVARATRDVVTLLDALGTPIILIETVGAGQAQVEVARVAHTVVLVEAPGMGDDVQALKAGLLEIADIIVVNKADRPEARQTLRALQSIRLGGSASSGKHGPGAAKPMHDDEPSWPVPILQASALEGQGVEELVDAILAHRDHLTVSHAWEDRRARHAQAEVNAWLQRDLEALFAAHVEVEEVERAVARVLQREIDPASAAQELVRRLVQNLKTESQAT